MTSADKQLWKLRSCSLPARATPLLVSVRREGTKCRSIVRHSAFKSTVKTPYLWWVTVDKRLMYCSAIAVMLGAVWRCNLPKSYYSKKLFDRALFTSPNRFNVSKYIQNQFIRRSAILGALSFSEKKKKKPKLLSVTYSTENTVYSLHERLFWQSLLACPIHTLIPFFP